MDMLQLINGNMSFDSRNHKKLSTQHVLAQIHFWGNHHIVGSKSTHLVSQDTSLEVKQNDWILAKGVSTSNIPG